MMYFVVKYISIHHICTYLSHFCNYIVTTYVTSLTTNCVLPYDSTFVIMPTNDRVHQKMPHASIIIIRSGFHILPLQLYL